MEPHHEQQKPQQEEQQQQPPPMEATAAATVAPTAAAAAGPTPPSPPRRHHYRNVELVPPQEFGMQQQQQDPAVAALAPGAGGRNAQPLPHQLRARLQHHETAAGRLRSSGEDPHAPRHPPPAELTPLAPQVLASAGMQRELVKGADEEVSRRLGEHSARDKGGRRGKHVDSASVGPAARLNSQQRFTP
jgi:hypothetical protein